MGKYQNTLQNRNLFRRRFDISEAPTVDFEEQENQIDGEAEMEEILRSLDGLSPRTGWNKTPIVPLDQALKLEIEPLKCHVYKLDIGGEAYIGFTTLEPAERVALHIKDAKDGSRLAVHAKLRQFGYLFDLELLATEENEVLGLVREISFIKKFSPELNSSQGGEGNIFELLFKKNELNEDVIFVKKGS